MRLADLLSNPLCADLPVVEAIPDVLAALAQGNRAILIAPPGAGKTTLVPLALLDAPWRGDDRIIVLEPRRLAARGAAARMADLLGEEVGGTVGYRVRLDSKVSKQTRIEVVTQGVFRRMLADDPMLDGIAAVIFDEFHERALDGDVALTLCLDVQDGLREDLRLLPMSATLDGDKLSAHLDAPVVSSEGRTFPVDVIYRETPPRMDESKALVAEVMDVIAEQPGHCLVFLPGQKEIEQAFAALRDRLPDTINLHRLYGAISHREQSDAIRPAPEGRRKLILASAIAETSLTIEGVRTVVDSGLARQPVYDPSSGLTRLATVRASRASIDQRAGRAGRTGPGLAIRLWREQQTAALPAFTPPEILNADLSDLLLDLRQWGVTDPETLTWIDAPPKAAIAEATRHLERLGALDGASDLTPLGRKAHGLALPPHLAVMVVRAGTFGRKAALMAAQLALLIQERGAGGGSVDLAVRLMALRDARDARSRSIVGLAASIAQQAGWSADATDMPDVGTLLAFGHGDRIAKRGAATRGDSVRFTMANGSAGELPVDHALAAADFIVVVELAGKAGRARILSAAEIALVAIKQHFSDHITLHREPVFDRQSTRFSVRETSRFGGIALSAAQTRPANAEDVPDLLASLLASDGLDVLPWQKGDKALRNRLRFLHHHNPETWPDLSDAALLNSIEDWLLPFMEGETSLSHLAQGKLSNGLMQLIGYHRQGDLDRLAPQHFVAPSGAALPLRYEDAGVTLEARPQHLFGLDIHPTVLDGTVPVTVSLVSPGGKPVGVTSDLPGLWRGSWADIRADMRGRYPKHPWPEDPLTAEPTSRAKPRR